MSLADKIAWKVQNFTRERLKNFRDDDKETKPFLKADTSFETNGLVPVSRVFVASQLMAAKWLFKTFPQVLLQQVRDAVSKVGGRIIAKQAAAIALKQVGGATIVGQLFAGAFEEILLRIGAEEVELTIRTMCAEVRKDFNAMVLPRASGKKKTRDVRTRHGTPGRAGRPRKRRRELARAKGPTPEFGHENQYVSGAATESPTNFDETYYANNTS